MTAFRRFIDWTLDHWLGWALFGSAFMLAVAHTFETFGHLNPCILCLHQRAIYWTAGAIALAGLAARATASQPPPVRYGVAGLSIILLIGMAVLMQQDYLYWVAVDLVVAVALAGVIAPWTPWSVQAGRLILAALSLCFLTGMGIAIWHSGAEWKFWPGPAACAANRFGVSTSDLALAMSGAKIKTPSCEEAAWRLFGLSMAGFNVLISLKLAAWSGLAALGWRAGK